MLTILLLVLLVALVYGTSTVITRVNDLDEGPTGKKYIALTFDDGPHQILTPKLLDIAKAKGAKFTFFVMGIKVDMHPDIVKRALEEGHEIANHAWDHPILTKLSLDDVSNQLRRTNKALQHATSSSSSSNGTTPTTMRPPYGNTNKRLNRFINTNENLTVVLWSYDTNDWKRPSPKAIADGIASRVVSSGTSSSSTSSSLSLSSSTTSSSLSSSPSSSSLTLR